MNVKYQFVIQNLETVQQFAQMEMVFAHLQIIVFASVDMLVCSAKFQLALEHLEILPKFATMEMELV